MAASGSRTIPIAIVAGGIIIAAAAYFSLYDPSSKAVGNPSLVRPVSASDHIFGNPAAKVTIIEYADFDCDYCAQFHTTMRQIMASVGTTGEVAWVFRPFPLIEVHANSFRHAQAAECVAEVGGNDAFWKFIEILYANQPIESRNYGTYALSAGAPGDAFAACYQGAAKRVDARITADRENALLIGAYGTPYSLILVEGESPFVMDGAFPYEAVKTLVDQALLKTQ